MDKSSSDKIKKLFEDVKEIYQRLEKFKIVGQEKDIVKSGNSAHILMCKQDIGKKALVIILPDLKNI